MQWCWVWELLSSLQLYLTEVAVTENFLYLATSHPTSGLLWLMPQSLKGIAVNDTVCPATHALENISAFWFQVSLEISLLGSLGSLIQAFFFRARLLSNRGNPCSSHTFQSITYLHLSLPRFMKYQGFQIEPPSTVNDFHLLLTPT